MIGLRQDAGNPLIEMSVLIPPGRRVSGTEWKKTEKKRFHDEGLSRLRWKVA